MLLKVFRFNPESRESRHDTFSIADRPGLTVLGALFEAQRDYDSSLAFRYSCRGAVCGTCAMLINKVPRLACRTQVGPLLTGEDKIDLSHPPKGDLTAPWDQSQEILVEPLPNLPVIKDLVVDMRPFFVFYKLVEPVFRQSGEKPERERLMRPEQVKSLEEYTSCILCGAC
ncbi:MAG: 2Fe-2S iron-sulfur cluster binding domain-containing protein, partial [Methanoregulaceae archaeon]|nr:2Fe-2S iron-sulfur cluster binding domain-containing protein [Methanoregulaceae archaeon]